jgi:peptide chain release factor 1
LLEEAGIHRIQRIPPTESSGRIHTSTFGCSVFDSMDFPNINFSEKDCNIIYMRSKGPGGQNANVSNSAVKVVHNPTGISVSCQEFRNAHQNLSQAMEALKAKIYEKMVSIHNYDKSKEKKAHFKNGRRSEKNRTYNFQNDKVILHDLGLFYNGAINYLKGSFFIEKSSIFLLNELLFSFKEKKTKEDDD